MTDHLNVTSITDNGVGDFTLTWDRDFANATYAVSIQPIRTGLSHAAINAGAVAAGTIRYTIQDATADADFDHMVIAIGDQ